MINLEFDDRGAGDPVLFIAGRGGAGRTWHLFQIPAFQRAGYRCITFDNRGIGKTENAQGFTLATMVGDTATIIEQLVGGPVRLVAVSMGAYIAQELMLTRPELVSQAVLMATRGRHDKTRTFFMDAENKMMASGVQPPAEFDAKVRLLEGFSPRSLNDDKFVADWIDMFTMWPIKATPGLHAQVNVAPTQNRLASYLGITAPTLVIGFADDVVVPAYLGAEVAAAIPNAAYLEIPDTGHLGFIEKPDAVNTAILEFFASTRV